MTIMLELSPDLQKRIEAIAARTRRTPAEVVADALENGHSLEWEEHYLDKVEEGLAAAQRGDFASPAEIERVLNKYRPA